MTPRRAVAGQLSLDDVPPAPAARPVRDVKVGQAFRDAGMAQVWDYAAEDWKARALEAILALAKGGEPFTSEDVRARAGDPDRPNASGALFNRAARRGLIEHVGWAKAKRPGMHATDLRLWRGTARAKEARGG